MIANLSNLSTTFTLNTSERLATNPDNFAELLISISPSLESMGTAFSSSLVGLGFNLLLTGLVYLIWDTNFSKNQLLSTVEHYLDNIVQPSIDGKSRFDKAVDKLTARFDHFLTNFGATVRDGVNQALKDKIQEIVEVNHQAAKLTIEAQDGFYQSSSSLARSAEIFEQASILIGESQLPQSMAEFIIEFQNIQSLFGKSSQSMQSSVKNLEESVKTVHENSANIERLLKLLLPLVEYSQNSVQQDIQYKEALIETTINLQNSIDGIQDLTQKTEESSQLFLKNSNNLVQQLEDLTKFLKEQEQHHVDYNDEILRNLGIYQAKFDQGLENLISAYQANLNQNDQYIQEIKNLVNFLQKSQPKESIIVPTIQQNNDPESKSSPPAMTANNLDSDKAQFKKLKQCLNENDEFTSRFILNHLLPKHPNNNELKYLALDLALRQKNLDEARKYYSILMKSISNRENRQKIQNLINKHGHNSL